MGVGEALAVGFLARQAATAVAYTRQQLGYTDRAALFAHLRPGFRVLEIGPGEGACHRHLPPGLHYTAVDAPLDPSEVGVPELPVHATCESFRMLRGPWQELLPALASGQERASFDSVVVVRPSTLDFRPALALTLPSPSPALSPSPTPDAPTTSPSLSFSPSLSPSLEQVMPSTIYFGPGQGVASGAPPGRKRRTGGHGAIGLPGLPKGARTEGAIRPVGQSGLMGHGLSPAQAWGPWLEGRGLRAVA